MDYTKFTVEDFASDEYFLRWVLDRDPEADRFWSIFILTHPQLEYTIGQARTLVLNIGTAESRKNDGAGVESVWARIQDTVDNVGVENEPQPETRRRLRLVPLAIAVVVAVVAFVLVPHLGKQPLSEDAYTLVFDGFVEEINETAETVRVTLSDSSVVELDPLSRIKYRQDYKTLPIREVYLSGSAFFDIRKNTKQPFIVRSNDVITEVLGTSFRVHAPKNENKVVVSVKTGKVSVYSASGDKEISKTDGVILLPNQEVAYEREDQSFNKKLINDPVIVKPQLSPDDFTFENTPVKDVFRRLEEAYGIEIIFDAETMKDCYLTAPLGSEPLFEKLQIICQTIGGKYEVIDAKIVISGSGCQTS